MFFALKPYTPSNLSSRGHYIAFSVNVTIYLSSCNACSFSQMEKSEVANVLLHSTSRSPSNGLKPNTLQCEGMSGLRYLLCRSTSANLSQNCVGYSYSLTAVQAINIKIGNMILHRSKSLSDMRPSLDKRPSIDRRPP